MDDEANWPRFFAIWASVALVGWTGFVGWGAWRWKSFVETSGASEIYTKMRIDAMMGLTQQQFADAWSAEPFRTNFITSFEVGMIHERVVEWAPIAAVLAVFAIIAAIFSLRRSGS